MFLYLFAFLLNLARRRMCSDGDDETVSILDISSSILILLLLSIKLMIFTLTLFLMPFFFMNLIIEGCLLVSKIGSRLFTCYVGAVIIIVYLYCYSWLVIKFTNYLLFSDYKNLSDHTVSSNEH